MKITIKHVSISGVHSHGFVVDHNRDVMDMEIDEIQNKLTKADDREIEAMEVVDIVVCFHNVLVHASYFTDRYVTPYFQFHHLLI